ncbi:DUF6891 domain-containing protein [Kitasatospora cheerisanensis]|uniref:DUF6891 domain-containing protein n=1 Tax=Kitasatospora cheerisanensis KCTC 2395 TaxID=1348663 RepID=A0A066YP01_9ACTN|nr:hypothetical protein [Kitasatospora cheerisanensis]KDN82987.1 hypothetical protein KCH_51330 [Kitasatospora cheerisanensis KCTC 2395]
MLDIAVKDQSDEVRVRVSEVELVDLVQDMGAWDGAFLVLQRVPDLPDVYVQTCPVGGEWTVEHRAGSPTRHYETRVADLERVADLLIRWSRQEADWDAGVEWQRMDFGPAPEPAPLELSEEDEKSLVEAVRGLLHRGYATRKQAAELAADHLRRDGADPVTAAQAEQLADRLWLERVAEQRTWTGRTDPERLAGAFTALEARGITARENFTCCHSCGQAEIGAEAEPDSRGFVYFHSQSTDHAVAGHGLSLYYGGFDGSEDTTAAIGREVVAALEESGLTVRWNGSPAQAIEVTGLDWRRRLIG